MRSSRVNLTMAAVSTVVTLLLALTATYTFLGSCRIHGIDPPHHLRNSPIIRRLFTNRRYRQLLAVATELDRDRFRTVWDFNEGVALSRSLFAPTEMFGHPKYTYLPNLELCYARVWTGVYYQPLIAPETDRISELLPRCHTDRLICFAMDAHGFKNDDSDYATGGPTVLFIGDSFTEGLWVAKQDAFPQRVGVLLSQHHMGTRTLNLGVNGYSVLEMRWVLEHFTPELTPRVAIMSLFPNDVATDYYAAIPDSSYQNMFAELDATIQFAHEHGVSLLISIIPDKEQFTVHKDDLDFQRRVTTWCAEHGAKCLDPYHFMASHGGEKLYLPWDPHITEEGHRVLAEFLLPEISALLGHSAEAPMIREAIPSD